MAKKATTEARPRRPRQQAIPGTDPPSIKEIDDAAEEFVDRRDMRMGLATEEADAKKKLLEVMRTHGLDVYEFEDFIVTRTEEQNVNVRKKKKAKPESNGDNGEDE